MLFKLKDNFNWKYIIGEVLLIFIGINLAIWFNNWNISNKYDRDKNIALTKIQEEIEKNREELQFTHEKNRLILEAYEAYQKLYDGNSSNLITTPAHSAQLQEKFPDFFRLEDSLEIEPGIYHYIGTTYIELEIPTLTDIAWETTKSIGITNEFNYECLYDLESMYTLQSRVRKEIDKASGALQQREITQLMNILGFISQLDSHLLNRYESMLEQIKDCN